ncbi:transcriptional family amidohydrolase family protein [Colletotrichum sojae]|uniref:Transcriptional family amidohydrolase family protein n=1 Tax=Colletotrichum sojae TaxID=2175907 RepID=A0A8H6N2W7_9PEZI|nr:transcriptional family amidohydrolase family protein [Colletotrichum sojae]
MAASSDSSEKPTSIVLRPDTWDTHVHVFDSAVGPFAPSRSYTPAQATLEQLLQFSSGLTKDRPTNIVLVQPSPYRTDNTVLLHSLRRLRDGGFRHARGIAVVDVDAVSDKELWEMHGLGVRGLRINMQADGADTDVEALREVVVRTAERIRGLPGWKIQFTDLYETIANLSVDVIADHVGGLRGSSKLDPGAVVSDEALLMQPGLESLVKLATQSKVVIKISGLYRLSDEADSGYDDLGPVIRTLAEAVPDRLVWGSDWPHTGEGKDRLKRGKEAIEEFRQIDDEQVINNLRQWIGNENWLKMMTANPAKIYA